MNKQLKIQFDTSKTINPVCFLNNVNDGLVFQNGIKNADFVVYNPLNIMLKEEKPILHKIKLKENKFWQKIKSITWSSNCRFFFVINSSHIIIGNTHDNEAFLCSNLSIQVFNEFFNAFAWSR